MRALSVVEHGWFTHRVHTSNSPVGAFLSSHRHPAIPLCYNLFGRVGDPRWSMQASGAVTSDDNYAAISLTASAVSHEATALTFKMPPIRRASCVDVSAGPVLGRRLSRPEMFRPRPPTDCRASPPVASTAVALAAVASRTVAFRGVGSIQRRRGERVSIAGGARARGPRVAGSNRDATSLLEDPALVFLRSGRMA